MQLPKFGRGTAPRSTAPLPSSERAPFVYLFDPRRWQVLAGKVVPHLVTQRLIGGVNGIVENADGSFNLEALERNLAREPEPTRRQILDPAEHGYLEQDDQTGRVFSRWQAYDHTTLRVETIDAQGFASWLYGLREVYGNPSPAVLRRMRSDAESDLQRAQQAGDEIGSRRARERLDAIEAEIG